jgi:biotin-dependent carboxylase-like uncharacterized protein
MSGLEAVDPGPLTTLQDRGRRGWQRYGVSPAGALDPVSLALANALVGNAPDEAALEFTLLGGTWRCAAESVRIAIAGGAFALRREDAPESAGRSLTLRRGETLAIGAAPDAARGYIAVEGGFAVAPELGSRSVHLRSGLGGGPVGRGEIVPLHRAAASPGPERALDPTLVPARRRVIRVVPGPQDDYFPAATLALFQSADWLVTAETDRMGMKLSGPTLAHAGGFDVLSDGIATGSIQVPGNGQPIVLLNDRQTTGGYPKIATAISADLPSLGQLRPGDRLRFAAVSLAEACAARVALDQALERALAAVAPARDAADLGSARLLGLNLVGGVVDARDA